MAIILRIELYDYSLRVTYDSKLDLLPVFIEDDHFDLTK